ncbi:MAG: hypothetical protein NTV70_23990 [Acidobacteria bacterium]|nr:hypothetical protein [Acidobacteriota bacterium]
MRTGDSGYRVEQTTIHGRRADGSTVTAHENSDGNRERELQWANGTVVDVAADLGLKSTLKHEPAKLAAGQMDPARECRFTRGGEALLGFVKTGEEEISGYATFKLEQASASGTWTMWLAPALGCAELRRTVRFPAGGAPKGTENLIEVTSIVLQEPGRKFFDLSGLSEVKPSELMIARARRTAQHKGMELPATEVARFQQLNQPKDQLHAAQTQ